MYGYLRLDGRISSSWIFSRARLRLFGLGSVGTESGNKLLKFFDLFFFLFVGFLHLFDEELAGLKPEVIVSGIELNLAVVDVCCMSTYFI